MAKYRVTGPDGATYEVSAPDGASEAEIISYAQRNFQAPAKQEAAETPSMGEILKREFLGSIPVQAAMGALRGAGSIGATLMRPMESGAENQQRRQAMTGGLQEMGADPSSIAFGAGKLGGEIAGTAGIGTVLGLPFRGLPAVQSALQSGGMVTGMAPATMGGRAADMALRTVAGGATGGAAAGMVDPSQMGTGAAIGAALPGFLKLAGGAGSAIGRGFSMGGAQNKELAKTAVNKYGIPLGIGDIAEGGTTKAVQSILRDAPITGGMAANKREAVQEAFNSAVGGTFGAPAPKLTPQVIDTAKQKLGAEFDRIWNNNALQVDPQMVQRMADLRTQAAKLPKNEGASLTAEIDDLFGKMIPDQTGALYVPGDVANKFQSYIRRRAESSAGLKNELGDLRREIIDAFNRSVAPADAAALTLNRSQYKAFKTVEPLLNAAEMGVAGRAPGDIPAALLPNAVARSYNRGGGPLAELSQIGSRFIVDRTPKTGGSARAAIQNTALGAALLGGYMTNPALALAAVPAAAGVQGLLGSPALARNLLNTSPNAMPIGAGLLGATYRAAPLIPAQ